MSDTLPAVRETSRELAAGGQGRARPLATAVRPLAQALRAAGTELWLDTGDRDAAAQHWGPELSALTTNNTLVNQVIQTGRLDAALAEAARELKRAAGADVTEDDLVAELGFIANAQVALDLVRTFDVRVSVETHPKVAEDADATVWWARRYYELCPSHFRIKVPLTPSGCVAVRRLSSEGIPVNFTLGFSARQNVLAARFARPAYVNVFLGRLNSVVADNKLGSGENVGERACLASDAQMKRIRSETGATGPLQIAASMRGAGQLVTLAGVDVFTAPPKAFEGFLKLDISPDEVKRYPTTELPVEADIDLSSLWEVSEAVRTLGAAVDSRGVDTARDLVALSMEAGVGDLFHAWTDDERAEVRADGKIPVLSKWLGRIALDDLMTRAALESFRVDQNALDDRIRSLLQ